MKFGSREVCDVVFRAKSKMKLGNQVFYPGQPVLLIDTAKTSTLEGDSETTYATGGRGNAQLLGWGGSKTMTFTVEDAMFSPIGISILMGADIAETKSHQEVHVHKMIKVTADTSNELDLSVLVKGTTGAPIQHVCKDAPLYVIACETDGSITSDYIQKVELSTADYDADTKKQKISNQTGESGIVAGNTYIVDCYVIREAAKVTEIQVRKDKFAGYFYVEAETLYRRQDSGNDMPAVITFPKVKIQSNFSIAMSADGDPSTATFTMDAFPDYTYFDKTTEVMCVFQIINDDEGSIEDVNPVMLHSKTTEGDNHPTVLRKEGTTTYGFSDSYRGNNEDGYKYDDPESTTTSPTIP